MGWLLRALFTALIHTVNNSVNKRPLIHKPHFPRQHRKGTFRQLRPFRGWKIQEQALRPRGGKRLHFPSQDRSSMTLHCVDRNLEEAEVLRFA